jgi:hypothetical protein
MVCFLNVYITLILSRNGTGVILGVFYAIFYRQNFVVGHHTKVVIHSPPAPLDSYHVSKLKQQSNGHLIHKKSVLPELSCPHQLEPSNHTREPSPRVL